VLQLRRLEIQGFKSFAERTELRFQGTGFAGVVGPNGCGKSNLADAISWVLGEQSAKSLRGSRMEDVIFSGTRDRKAVGMASVTMMLVDPNPDREPDAAATNGHTNGKSNGLPRPKEVTITRRLFRSGESEYLIDGKHARLRDIQDIFMGTGLGPESYAIIEQGRITQILSTKPQERRAVIEEAAGVSKFKTRRRLAEAKLESAKQNLSRVFDILEEVGRQANSLKRQAARARRYEELKTEMLGYLRRALLGRYLVRQREAAKTALDLNDANRAFQQLSSQVTEQEKLQASLQEQCFALEHELTARRGVLSEFRVEAERTRGRLESQAAQAAAIGKRLSQGESEIQDMEAREKVLEQEFQSHADTLAELNQQAEQSRIRLEQKREERDRRQAELREREQAIERGRQAVLKLLGESSALKNQLAQIGEYLSGLEREKTRSRTEADAASGDLKRIQKQKEEIARQIAARQMDLMSTAGRRREIEEQLQQRRGRATELSRTLDQCRSEVSRLRARRDSTQEILSHRSYTTESVKRLFTAIEHGEARELEPLGVLADFVEVTPAWEKATEEFLHDELEYVVVRTWDDAAKGVDVMRGELDGRATFLVHPEPESSIPSCVPEEPSIGPETGIVAKLSGQLRMTNGLTKAPAELIPRLARCFLVEDREVAQRLSLQYPDLYFLLSDGVSFHGHAVSGGKKTGRGPLALKRELRELIVLVEEKQAEEDRQAGELKTLENEIGALNEDLDLVKAKQQTQERDALALEHEMRKLGEDLSRVNQRLSVAGLEMERLKSESAKTDARRAEIEESYQRAEEARLKEEQALESARLEIGECQAKAAHVAEEHAAVREDMAGLEERRKAEQAARVRLDGQIREMAARRQELSLEIERMGAERARLLADNLELDAVLGEMASQIALCEAQVRDLAEREAQTRVQLAGVEEALRGARAATSEAQENRGHIEVQLVKLESELQYLEETCRKEFQCSLEELSRGEETVPEESELAEAEMKHQELRTRIENLGPVNPQAMEEFEEAQQRYDFLNAQRQDLLDSIRDTEKAIQEIDGESRRRFNDAFQAINENFKHMFTTLFHGGVGEMRLTDPENESESGIDIMASPPGKRLQNVLLLSGGERSLTAMALLLAIFQYQPSPFCVLDEVDAALDEANITRLVKLLKQMAHETQFITITHAKRTMEASETLYGVTMQEPGVSKIVSVRFQEAAPPPKPVPEYAMAIGAD
jgi:chromosome segregation protein